MDRTALFNLSYGVYVVSSVDGNRNVGCVVNSIFQVSSSPATLALSINKDNYTNPCILNSGRFTVSILNENSNEAISIFGFKSSKNVDKFENVEFFTTENGIPVLTAETCAYLECKVIDSVDCFSHTIIIADIIDAKNLTGETPMTYAYYHKVIKGKAPKNAPTYIENTKPGQLSYVCNICGYEYPGNHSEFMSLPDSYECPVCAALKSAFELK